MHAGQVARRSARWWRSARPACAGNSMISGSRLGRAEPRPGRAVRAASPGAGPVTRRCLWCGAVCGVSGSRWAGMARHPANRGQLVPCRRLGEMPPVAWTLARARARARARGVSAGRERAPVWVRRCLRCVGVTLGRDAPTCRQSGGGLVPGWRLGRGRCLWPGPGPGPGPVAWAWAWACGLGGVGLWPGRGPVARAWARVRRGFSGCRGDPGPGWPDMPQSGRQGQGHLAGAAGSSGMA